MIGKIIALIIFLALMAYVWNAFQDQGKMLDDGCKPLTWNSWGLATAMECPQGKGHIGGWK